MDAQRNKFEGVVYALDQLRDFNEYMLKDVDDIEERQFLSEEVEMYKTYVACFKSGVVLDEDIASVLEILFTEIEVSMDMVTDTFKSKEIDSLECGASNLFTYTVAYNELLKIQKSRAS